MKIYLLTLLTLINLFGKDLPFSIIDDSCNCQEVEVCKVDEELEKKKLQILDSLRGKNSTLKAEIDRLQKFVVEQSEWQDSTVVYVQNLEKKLKEASKYKKRLNRQLLKNRKLEDQLKKHINNNSVTVKRLMFQDNYRPRGRATFQQVINYCQNLKLLGFDDWRVPSREEYFIAFKYKRYFKAMKDSWHWTFTKFNNSRAFIIDLEDSDIDNDEVDDKYYGLCVRSIK